MAIVFRVKPWYAKKGGGNPDDYFDPVTHIATEENFIKFLDCRVYDSKYIGYGVDLGTTGIWIIEDVNHDSANTGQTNCYDLISKDCFGPSTKWSSNGRVYYRDSLVRQLLTTDILSSLSAQIRQRLMPINYESRDQWYTDDYIVAPSYCRENSTTTTSGYPIEGAAYTNLVNGSNRRKRYDNEYVAWWTRTSNDVPSIPTQQNSVAYIASNASINRKLSTNTGYMVGIIRIH